MWNKWSNTLHRGQHRFIWCWWRCCKFHLSANRGECNCFKKRTETIWCCFRGQRCRSSSSQLCTKFYWEWLTSLRWFARDFQCTNYSRSRNGRLDIFEPTGLFNFLTRLQSSLQFGCKSACRFVTNHHWVIRADYNLTKIAQVEQLNIGLSGFCFVKPFSYAQLRKQLLRHRDKTIGRHQWLSFLLQLVILLFNGITNGLDATNECTLCNSTLFNRKCVEHSCTMDALWLQTFSGWTLRQFRWGSERRTTWTTIARLFAISAFARRTLIAIASRLTVAVAFWLTVFALVSKLLRDRLKLFFGSKNFQDVSADGFFFCLNERKNFYAIKIELGFNFERVTSLCAGIKN